MPFSPAIRRNLGSGHTAFTLLWVKSQNLWKLSSGSGHSDEECPSTGAIVGVATCLHEGYLNPRPFGPMDSQHHRLPSVQHHPCQAATREQGSKGRPAGQPFTHTMTDTHVFSNPWVAYPLHQRNPSQPVSIAIHSDTTTAQGSTMQHTKTQYGQEALRAPQAHGR